MARTKADPVREAVEAEREACALAAEAEAERCSAKAKEERKTKDPWAAHAWEMAAMTAALVAEIIRDRKPKLARLSGRQRKGGRT